MHVKFLGKNWEMSRMDNKIKNAYESIELSETKKRDVLEKLVRADCFNEKKVRKISFQKPFAAVAVIAVALTVTVTAGATVYGHFSNRDSVEKYFGDSGADRLESMELTENTVAENEHIRFTADTVVCDGNYFLAIVTYEALDEIGENNISTLECSEPDIDTNDLKTFGTTARDYSDSDTRKSFVIDFPMSALKSNDGTVSFTFGAFSDNGDGCFDGLSLTFSTEKNVESKILENSSGKTLELSQIGIFSTEKFSLSDTELIRSDGTYESLDSSRIFQHSNDTDEYYGVLGEIIDLDEYVGVSVSGEVYTEK